MPIIRRLVIARGDQTIYVSIRLGVPMEVCLRDVGYYRFIHMSSLTGGVVLPVDRGYTRRSVALPLVNDAEQMFIGQKSTQVVAEEANHAVHSVRRATGGVWSDYHVVYVPQRVVFG